MRAITAATAVACSLLAAACASSRMLSYGTELGDAVVRLGPAAFSVYIHPTDDTLMIQRGIGQAGAADSPELIQIVGTTFLRPADCALLSAPSLIGPGTWEASFRCPADVDLRSLATTQRQSLRAGQPLEKVMP